MGPDRSNNRCADTSVVITLSVYMWGNESPPGVSVRLFNSFASVKCIPTNHNRRLPSLPLLHHHNASINASIPVLLPPPHPRYSLHELDLDITCLYSICSSTENRKREKDQGETENREEWRDSRWEMDWWERLRQRKRERNTTERKAGLERQEVTDRRRKDRERERERERECGRGRAGGMERGKDGWREEGFNPARITVQTGAG